MIEMPWVIETRLAPGQRVKRNPVWGIVALVLAIVSAVFFFGFFVAVFNGVNPLPALPVWGIVALLGAAFTVAAFVKRGGANIGMGAAAGFVLAGTNPVLFLVVAIPLGL